ncbi:glycosyltransferase family 4 protein [Enterococcus gallinarum]|uniref:glycosyltransferase family 4 protein n=1 Tax=Enterococcus gallinarum TaxID=1353 RepID=UPI00147277C4|nr:glycosyltransferase family 4 protein [Enterococcus gallinarum]MDV7823333.1 glycosyltransferase family 4 protein [Enterococcus gallinarum]MDV7872585.1 glycosyltransferase family 4 protein [Enterococcus gallinarum]NME48359.1 glycosyltransferase family 4 protein [Enterococcus gallinarum]
MRKDVLFMCQFFYPEYVSSALLPYQTALGLRNAGLTIDIMCGYPKEYMGKEKIILKKEVVEGMTIFRKKYLQLGRKNFLSRLINYFSFTATMILNIMKCRNYKVIIVYSNPPILPLVTIIAKKLFQCKIIFVAYDLYPEIAERTNAISENSLISKVMRKINSKLFPNVSQVVALSNDMKNFIVSEREIQSDRVTVIQNWATENFEIASIKSREFSELREKYQIIISYFGNMGTAQDMQTIIDVISNPLIQKNEIGFLFAGHGNKQEEIKNSIKRNRLENCYLYDYLSGSDFNDALNITNLFIVSLEKDLAGLAVPSKTYSYYQAKKPVIAIMSENTDISKEIYENNAGISVKNGESEKLVNWLLLLLKDKNQVLQMEKNMKNRITVSYNSHIQIEKYKNMIFKVLEE